MVWIYIFTYIVIHNQQSAARKIVSYRRQDYGNLHKDLFRSDAKIRKPS